jgi:hypothetical protein
VAGREKDRPGEAGPGFWSVNKQNVLLGFSTETVPADSVIRGMASRSALLIRIETARKGMTVWPDPRSEMQSLVLREITARLLIESDSQRLHTLIEELADILEAQLRRCPPN